MQSDVLCADVAREASMRDTMLPFTDGELRELILRREVDMLTVERRRLLDLVAKNDLSLERLALEKRHLIDCVADRDRSVELLALEKSQLLDLVADRDHAIEGYRVALAETTAHAAAHAKDQERQAEIARAEIAQLRHRLAAKDSLLRALYASTSWRFTAPLRRLTALLRGHAAPRPEVAIAETDRVVPLPLPLVALPAPAMPMPMPMPKPQTAVAVPAPALSDRALSLGAEPAIPVPAAAVPAGLGEIVILSDHPPLFDRQSGGLRLLTLIRMIAELGWNVTFCSYLSAGQPDLLAPARERARYESALRAAGVTRIAYGLDGMRETLAELGETVRLAFVSFPVVATEVIPIIRTHCPWARILFDTVDLHFVRVGREASLRQSEALRAEADRLRALEFSCMRMADVTITVTEAERLMMLDLLPDVVFETIPNVFAESGRPRPGPEGRSGVLFLGGFQHEPNIDAVLWFVREIWPQIRARAPQTIFRVVGAEVPPVIAALKAEPGVEIMGYVADLAPVFDQARLMVAPLRYGAGMKGKVGQAMMSGLPVVSTSIGAEGMAMEDGRHILVADDPGRFAEHVLSLLDDDGLWELLHEEGHALIDATLSERAVAAQVARLFHV